MIWPVPRLTVLWAAAALLVLLVLLDAARKKKAAAGSAQRGGLNPPSNVATLTPQQVLHGGWSHADS